ncbi:MAG: hypothetical protein H6Q59_3157, partial [Firmicutes bacterium]|nr:hypothetical protein [Bacillota bacterium]
MTLIIGIITTIITLLIIALEVMIGYERGIRRNLIRTVMLIGVAALTMCITSPIVEFVVRKLVVTNRLNDYLYGLTGVNPGGLYFFQESAVNLFTIFLNPFVYVVLFWIFKFITFGIYLLMDRYVINKKLTKLFPSPTKKSCIGGAILGGFYAILIGAIFFMPVSAYSELLQRTETATIAAGQTGGVSELLGANRYRMAVGYHNTPAYYFYKYTGTKLLGDAMFSSLTKKNVAIATISVDQSIPSIVKVYYASKVLRNGITQNQSAEEYTDYINSLNIIVDEYSTNELIIGTEEEKVALVNDLLKQGDVFADSSMAQSIMTNMDYTSLSAFQQDIKTLTEFSSLLREKGILTDLLKDAPNVTPKE